MSMERCSRCSRSIDTDFDLDCYRHVIHGRGCRSESIPEAFCEICREEYDLENGMPEE